ncbi:MAG: glucan biosynthesis protein G [Gemmobacter sp.]|nr:glucan biosynthesis protein G [Gemmobacter sp.]
MSSLPVGSVSLSRRGLLRAMTAYGALLCSSGMVQQAFAQAQTQDAVPFSFDLLTDEMRENATRSPESIALATGFLDDLGYDDYKNIAFRGDRARWTASEGLMQVHAFHMGWLFDAPVRMFEVEGGLARPMVFSTDDFDYRQGLADRIPPHVDMPGVAGFRLHTPLNRPDVFDELVAFLGASYFRALGRGNSYGISARGLAINTGLSVAEEFPRFSRFYLEKPAPLATDVVVFAALESESCTGAYQFVIRPGETTVMEVTARLFFRNEVEEIGIGALTSMFLYSEKNRTGFDDYRPKVHDSEGLRIVQQGGDVLWRPLNNPPRLTGSYFSEESPRSFGLMQRDRDFANYQDASAHYERRPSLVVEPLGDWGRGAVRLVEIPTDLEVNDNIVAFWVPEAPVIPGEMREYSYRLNWGALAADPNKTIAYVLETRSGAGGVSGGGNPDGTKKFVIDFAGGILAALEDGAAIEAVTNISSGTIVIQTLSKVPDTGIWRLVLDVSARSGETVELAAHVRGYGRKLTENWLYQWIV